MPKNTHTPDTRQPEADALHAWVRAFENRIAKADKRGGVELHVLLDDARRLARLARIATRLLREESDRKSGGAS